MEKDTVWVLLAEHNDFNQHGQYFVQGFNEYPGILELAKAFEQADINIAESIEGGLAFLSELLKNKKIELQPDEITFYLEEVKLV